MLSPLIRRPLGCAGVYLWRMNFAVIESYKYGFKPLEDGIWAIGILNRGDKEECLLFLIGKQHTVSDALSSRQIPEVNHHYMKLKKSLEWPSILLITREILQQIIIFIASFCCV